MGKCKLCRIGEAEFGHNERLICYFDITNVPEKMFVGLKINQTWIIC